jgi:molybdenum cofactor synthesis domain-containing protein
MKLPDKFDILVITLSDRAFRGVYEDLSGPRIKERIAEFCNSAAWEADIDLIIIPDEADRFRAVLMDASNKKNLIFTTGGTGIGPRDITVETVKPLLNKEIPGIMEFIRIKYGTDKPNALLSRSIAGIMGKALVYTLPGSVKAVDEYMSEIVKTLKHTVFMQYGIDVHDKH